MRIDPNARLAATPDSGESAKSAAKTAHPLPGAEALGTDRAELSIDQARVHALAAQVNSLPEVRQEKVAALARALRNGEYKVSPEQTADAMLSEISGHRAAA